MIIQAKTDMSKKVTKYIRNLQYSPALVNNKPVASAQTLFVKHTYSEAGHSEGSVTPAFAKEYQATIDALSSPTADMLNIKKIHRQFGRRPY